MLKTINIAGIPTSVEEKNISIFEILFDHENPRISFYKDSHMDYSLSQDEIIFALKTKNMQAYMKLMDWYREFYPEMFDFPDIEMRLNIYAILHCLEDIAIFGGLKELEEIVEYMG